MPKLHVIYDPTDKLQTSHPDMSSSIKVAVMPLGDDDFANIGATAETLTCLLLDQIQKDKD